jgi:methionyl aminopeptidase
MRLLSKPEKLQNHFVSLQHSDWLDRQRIAGQSLAEVMIILQQLVADKTNLSLLEINKIVDDELDKRKCYPTFKNFKGFPAAICLSVNKQLVHGIPSDTKFQEGDVITFDFGATFEGAIADSAVTLIFGEPAKQEHVKLIETTRDCLYNAIKAMAVGKQIGVIGNAIYKTAKNAGFNVITKFGGHGIGWDKPHADLFVANKALPDEGIRIQPGLTIAIEPLLVPGNCSTNTRIADDGWTIYTEDVGSHAEHSLYVHTDHVEIISWRPEEEPMIPRKVYFTN